MKQFSGYEQAKEEARQMGVSSQLPEGGYVAKVKDVRFEEGQNGNSDRIVIAFDIAEGDYKDFFQKAFEANASEDKKWKGKATIYCPKDDGSEKDGWTRKAFARWTNAFEDSNPGYKWDWVESKWKGLLIGLVYGKTGTVIEGKPIVYTEVHYPTSVEAIRTKDFKPAKMKKKNGYEENATPAVSSDGFMSIPEGAGEDIPF